MDDRDVLLLNSKRYTVARGKDGQRLIKVTPRSSKPGDPGGIAYRDWIPWGHDFISREEQNVLGREYGDGTDGRWEPVDTLGPQINSLTLSTYDTAADIVDNANGMATADAWATLYAYIIRGSRPAKVDLATMTLVNAGDSLPRPATDVVTTYSEERQDALAVRGSKVDATNLNAARGVVISPDGNYAYVAANGGSRFSVVDITAPEAPSVVGTVQNGTTLAGVFGLAISASGRYVYAVCQSDDRLTVIDVLNPAAPAVVGSVKDATNLATATGISVSANGTYVYVSAYSTDRLTVVDVSTPASPTVTGSVTDAQLNGAYGVATSADGDYAYVASDLGSRLTVVDVTVPASPSITGSINDATNLAGAHGVSLSADGDYVYVTGTSSDRLTVVNVSTPASPAVSGSVTDVRLNVPFAVVTSPNGKYAYVTANAYDGVAVVNVQTPATPSIVRVIKGATTINGIADIAVSAEAGLVVTTSPLTSAVAVLTFALLEVAFGQGDTAGYQVLSVADIGEPPGADTIAENSAGEPSRIFGQDSKQVIALAGNTVRTNILLGAVTMDAPNWQLVSTLTGRRNATKFTGFAVDGNLWIAGTNDGPQYIEEHEGEFNPLIPEIELSDENCRQMTTWYPMGVVIPLRDGIRYSQALSGESWGPERFLGNSSAVQGYPTGVGTSLKWLVTAIYNEVTGVTWLVAWRPRQAGDSHPYPFSPYVIGKVPSSAVARFVQYVGYADGRRTTPAWIAGRNDGACWWLDGRTSRFIDDTSYRFALSGTTYGSELYLDGTLADIEAVEFMTANCTASRTVTPKISIDGGASYISLAAQTTNGFHRVLAVSGGVPLSTLQGAYRIKEAHDFATNVNTSAPQIISPIRVYWRWRPVLLRDFEYDLELDEDDASQPTAKEQAENLMTAWGAAPVAVEDPDNGTYYIRVNRVTVTEQQDDGGNAVAGERGSIRTAHITATEWKVA